MQVPLAPVATKPNTAAAGAAIDRVKGNATGDLGAVVRELTALDDRALDGALEMVAGEIHASRLQLALIESESFTDPVRTGLMDRAHERERAATGWGGQRLRWWGQLSGERAIFDATHLSRGGIADLGAGAGGFDWRASDRWLFGGGGGFGAGNMNLNGLSGRPTTRRRARSGTPGSDRAASASRVPAAPHGLHPIPNDASSLRR